MDLYLMKTQQGDVTYMLYAVFITTTIKCCQLTKAMAQTPTHHFGEPSLIQESPCGICGGQRKTATGSSPSTSVCSCHLSCYQSDHTSLSSKGKKVKCTLVQALRLCTGRTAYRGSRGVALFHDQGTRMGEGTASRPGRSLPPEKSR